MDAARIAEVLDAAYLEGIEALPMEELRARRAACQTLEVGLSYQRRMAQGRLDLVGAERSQRAGGASAPHVGDATDDMVDSLKGILADRGRAPGFGHLPQLMAPDEADLDTTELDAIVGPSTLSSLADKDDGELAALVDALSAYERSVSGHRHELHVRIDALQAEIARRYRTGEASVESLLT